MLMRKPDIASVIGNAAYVQRGVSYFHGRKVLSVQRRDSGLIIGKVQGSRGQIYHVEVTVRANGSGRLSGVEGNCSCPVGYNCKHVVAVLLEAARKLAEPIFPSLPTEYTQAAASGPVEPRLPEAIASWLSKLEAEQDVPSPTPAKLSQGTSKDAIFYVFQLDTYGKAEIVPHKGYVKKDGSLGKNVRKFDIGYDTPRPGSGATQYDAIILAQLRYFYTGGYAKTYTWPSGETLTLFLKQIVATGRARAVDIRGPALTWADPKKIECDWHLDECGEQRLKFSDKTGRDLTVLPFPRPVYIDGRDGLIGFAESDLPPDTVAMLTNAPPLPAEAVVSVTESLARHMGSSVPPPKPVPYEERTDLAPSVTLTLFGVERYESQRASYWEKAEKVKVIHPCIRAEIGYETSDQRLVPGEGSYIRQVGEDGLMIIRRNLDAEKMLFAKLESTAGEFEGYPPGYAYIEGRRPKEMKTAQIVFPSVLSSGDRSDSDVFSFTVEGLPRLQGLGWNIEVDPTWPIRLYPGEVHFQTVLEPLENDWFSLGLKLDVDGTHLDLTDTILQIVATLPIDDFGDLVEGFELKEFLSASTFYKLLPDGTMVPLPGLKLLGFIEAFLEVQGILRFHTADAARATVLAKALDGCGAPWEGGSEILELGQRLRCLSEPSNETLPVSLKADLRPYQKQGYGWLKALTESGFGGILADDMGLGKTVQTLALLANHHLDNKTDRPSLLVVPTSLISNWQSEAERFTPDLRLLSLHGPGRHDRFAEINAHDLVITTYPLINRDHEALFSHEFELAILDEAQAVKNPAASVAKRIRHIKARQRLALTGTPMENNLMELWTLFDWLIPGFLGDRKGFGSEYRKPIERKGDKARQRLLSSRVRPFLLRRTKDEVVQDLPPKTIMDESIVLAGKQAALYESVRSAMDARVRAAVKEKGLAGSRITVLDALLKLRQVCCDPRLVKLDAATKVKESAKRDRLNEILEELMRENRKVLVFSQFVEMLRLIESDVRDRGWPYAMLHGQTRDRKAEIEKFQSGEAQLFLISLKAGGTGLNLTAADTVVLYDPWWNPAVERQAMDRAHRIGQDKPVFVYRLYSENTVETAIQAMQAKKQELADALFEGGGAGALALTEDDLVNLFGIS